MKKRVAHWITGVVISAIAIHLYLFLFHTHLFTTVTINALNDYLLLPSQLKVEGRIEGGLLSESLGLSNIKLMTTPAEDTLFTAEELSLRGIHFNWTTKEWVVDQLSLNKFTYDSQFIRDIISPASNQNSNRSIVVNQIDASQGILNLEIYDSLQVVKLNKIEANLWMIDDFIGISFGSAELIAPSLSPDTLLLSGLLGIDPKKLLTIDDLLINSESLDLEIQSKIMADQLSAQVRGRHIAPSQFINKPIPSDYADIMVDFDLKLNQNSQGFELSGSGSIIQDAQTVPFNLGKYYQTSIGQSLELELGSDLNNMEIYADIDSLGVLTCLVDFFRINLEPFVKIKGLHFTEPIGQVSITGIDGAYTLKPRFELLTVNKLQIDSLSADILYSPNGDIRLTKGIMKQTENTLSYSGTIIDDTLDIGVIASISDFRFLELLSIPKGLQGEIGSKFHISGDIGHPRISGEMTPSNFGIKDQLTLSGLGKYDVEIEKSGLQGYFALQGNQGTVLRDSLLSYTISASFSRKDYEIEEFHLQGSKNIMSFAGFYGPSGMGINKLNFTVDQNQLKLVDNLYLSKSDKNSYDFPTCVFAFNQGGLSVQGTYEKNSGLGLSVNFELIDFDQITDFLGLGKSIRGIGTGKATITGSLNDPVIDAQFVLYNGNTIGYPSDTAKIDLTLKSYTVISNRIDAVKNDGSLTLIGQLPWGYKMRRDQIRTAVQNFSINFDNYRLADLKFKKVVGIPISGRASGSLAIRGTPIRTKLDGNIDIIDGRFDTLAFTSGHADFLYEGNLVTFDSLSMLSTWGYGSGTGFMPVSLDFVAEDRMKVADREMGLNFEFNLNEMPFLSSYISSIDRIRGDFIGNLDFTGSLSAPIRDGKVRGHNGYLELPILGNPITDIHSEFTLLDNTLSIDHFSGRMIFSEGSTLNIQGGVAKLPSLIGGLIGVNTAQAYNGVVNAQGKIDLQSFFHPKFDVKLIADEIYYRSTDGQIEAIADADLLLTGQDTLDVNAIIPVKRAAYYSNFESVESYQQTVSRTESSIFRYSLNTQFASDVLISNDQMEAEFEGELWLLDYGDGIMRFSGNLKALAGGKIFYLGNELLIVAGEIIFNSVDFNPQINVETKIEIDGEPVSLILSGDLNEPELVINAESTQLTQSDVLAYLTINQKLVEVSFDTQSALNPVKTYSAMLIEKQLSKIGRDLTGLDILDVGINLDSDTTTTPTFRVGQRLSKNLKVTYEGALQPIDGKSDYDFGLEYQINSKVSITSKVNQKGEVELNGRLKFTY
ncbi:translocation/assembly module TamB domain-containing protein [bacterium]|nr:translocation/assembly module TamB domain-containing protein [bacterium]